MADPALRRLGVPVPGLSTPMGKRHDPHLGVVVREDNAIGESFENQPPVFSIADPAWQLMKRFEDDSLARVREALRPDLRGVPRTSPSRPQAPPRHAATGEGFASPLGQASAQAPVRLIPRHWSFGAGVGRCGARVALFKPGLGPVLAGSVLHAREQFGSKLKPRFGWKRERCIK